MVINFSIFKKHPVLSTLALLFFIFILLTKPEYILGFIVLCVLIAIIIGLLLFLYFILKYFYYPLYLAFKEDPRKAMEKMEEDYDEWYRRGKWGRMQNYARRQAFRKK